MRYCCGQARKEGCAAEEFDRFYQFCIPPVRQHDGAARLAIFANLSRAVRRTRIAAINFDRYFPATLLLATTPAPDCSTNGLISTKGPGFPVDSAAVETACALPARLPFAAVRPVTDLLDIGFVGEAPLPGT
jgi:hypothetical protein